MLSSKPDGSGSSNQPSGSGRGPAGSSARAGKPGFGLIEVLLCLTLLGFVTALVFNSFIGARKAQGLAVATSQLKYEGERVMQRVYGELSQSRKLIANLDGDAATADLARAYFNYIDSYKGLYQPLPDASLVFPRIYRQAAFQTLATTNPEAFGNTLIFSTRLGELPVSGVTIDTDSSGATRLLTPQKPYRIYVYRFVAYYLAERNLSPTMPPINGGQTKVLNLVRWESDPYLEWGEVEGLMRRIPTAAVRRSLWNTLVTTPYNGEMIAGSWDSNQSDPSQAIFQMDVTGAQVATGARLKGHRSDNLTHFQMEPYALGMVSFNVGPSYPNFPMGGPLRVPGYVTSLNPTSVPYGFEVAITGSNIARAVLVRLVLAARVTASNDIVGFMNQKVIQAVDN